MASELVLFGISSLPIVLIMIFVYYKDKNKEPIELLIKLFLGGIGATLLVMIISRLLSFVFPIFNGEYQTLNGFQLIIYALICVALVEEISKWVMIYFISFKNKAFDELYDAIIYAVFVALGFAFFENLIYVYSYGISTGIGRAVLSVPAHACFGAFMGYYIGLAKISSINKRKDLFRKYIILSLIIPTLLHGIYDYFLFLERKDLMAFLLIFIVVMYISVIRIINRTSIKAISKIKYKNKFCTKCGHEISTNFCTICGNKNS